MRQPSKGKLRNRIFLVILVGLVPIAVVAGLGIYAVNSSHREDVARLESAVLTEKAQEVESYVNEEVLSHPRIVSPQGTNIAQSTATQEFALSQTMNVLTFLNAESFVNLNGEELVRLDRTHPDGYPADALRDMSATPEFLAARAGNYYIGPVSYASSTPSVIFSSPVEDDAKNVTGVLVGEANLTELQTIVAEAKIGTAGYLYLVDRQGNIIGGGGPMSETIGQEPAANGAGFPTVQAALAGEDLLTADTQATYANITGETVVAAEKYIPEFGWGLVVEWPTSEANAVINTLFFRNAITFAIVLLIAFAASLLLAAYVVRPVRKLQEGAARVAQGKFDEGVYIATGDELEALGDSFNNMVRGLKQLEQLKDEFVFIAAHELRTPVAAMKGYLSLILDGTTGAITDGTKAYVEKVIASDNRLVQLVNDLLEVARSEAGRLTIKVSPIDMAPLVRAVLDELKALADEKSVTMAYEPPADLPKAMGDADHVKEVMVNLVGNAIKYMGGAGTVTVLHEVEEGALVTRVADTGIGIAKEAQEKLFQKFYRVQTEKTRDITGTGLGLFIVREIVEKMGGKIWVESEEGKGSTFSVSLPLAKT